MSDDPAEVEIDGITDGVGVGCFILLVVFLYTASIVFLCIATYCCQAIIDWLGSW